MGSDRGSRRKTVERISFQSTLPYGERQSSSSFVLISMSVSIHAPVWGATLKAKFIRLTITVSIHAPVWGATLAEPVKVRAERSFNPRSRMGSDTKTIKKSERIKSFNPRSRMGSDVGASSYVHPECRFQSTLPYGERHIWVKS